MHLKSIPTPRLELVLQSPSELLALVSRLAPEDQAEVSPDWIARVRATPEGDPWALGFSIIKRDTAAEVGSCGFKGPPDPNGVVELAYAIHAPHQGRGFATEATQALAAFAFSTNQVSKVIAHTKPDNLASTRVLLKCGFTQLHQVLDPDDGLVLRFELSSAPL